MKFRSALTAAVPFVVAATLVAGLAGCSSSPTGPASGLKTSTPTSTVAAKTYTVDDLATILKTVQSKLAVTGTLLDNAQITAELAKQGGSFNSTLAQPGVTFSPASCAADFKTFISTATPSSLLRSEIETTGGTSITVASIPGSSQTEKYYASKVSTSQKVLGDCSDVTINDTPSGSSQAVTVGLSLTPENISTNADKSLAIQETVTLPAAAGSAGGTTTISEVTALSGNLLISVAEPASGATTTPGATAVPSVPTLVDAVVAASK